MRKHIYFIIFLILSSISFAQYDSLNISIENITLGGTAYSTFIEGDFCYIGSGSKFLILDVSEPDEPIEVGSCYTYGIIWDMKVIGDYAYIDVYKHGLMIMDISDPSMPFITSFYSTSSNLRKIDVAENIAYLAVEDDELIIVDVANPFLPVIMANIFVDSPMDVKVDFDYLYISSENSRISIYNIYDPFLPDYVNRITTSMNGYANHLEISDNKLIFLDGSFRVNDTIRVYNISSPSSAYQITKFDCKENVGDITVSDSLIAIADSSLKVYALLDTIFEIVDSVYYNNQIYDVKFSDGNIFTVDMDFGLKIHNFSEDSLLYAGSYPLDGNMVDIIVYSNYAYILEYTHGIKVMNISDISSPYEVALYEMDENPLKAALFENKLYVVSNTSLKVLDISSPELPTELGSFDFPYTTKDIEIDSCYTFILTRRNGLFILNTFDPSSIYEVSRLSIDGSPKSIYPTDSFIFVTENSYFCAIDISDISSPRAVGFSSGNCIDVDIVDNLAYVVTSTGLLKIYNITDPRHMNLISSTSFEDAFLNIIIEDDFAYTTCIDYALKTIDISDSTSPELTAHYYTRSTPTQIVLVDSFCLVLDDELALFTFDCSLIDPFDLISNINPGWNMISFPFEELFTTDIASSCIFEPFFFYNTPTSNYGAVDSLFDTGMGYWIFASSDTIINMTGRESVDEVTLELLPGWNLIGMPNTIIRASIFEAIPEITSSAYYFNTSTGTYEEPDILEPMKGYWIFSTDSLEITLP